jgi:hypothetical protein
MTQLINMEENKKPVDPIKQAYANVLQFITNNFYTSDGKEIQVVINNEDNNNHYDGNKIVLSESMLDAYGTLNLPRFLIYYHELGHHLYSKGMFLFLDTWSKITSGPLKWIKHYHHLINWIEDFFIEKQLKKEHAYLTDVIDCIRKLKPSYDITKIEYAFNYYYVNEAPTPALPYADQLVFKGYVDKLLTLRSTNTTRFGNGILTTLSIKQSVETQFALTIIEFYNWCVSKKIFDNTNNPPPPPLKNPNQHLQKADNKKDLTDFMQSITDQMKDGKTISKGSSLSEHSHKIGEFQYYKEESPIKEPTDLLKEELVQEKTLINKELLDMSQRMQVEQSTLDGLFTAKYKDSINIQPKVNVLNFFNPNRIADQNLFLEKGHTYMNVAIYRDISGSTAGETHRLMSVVCEQLFKDIPVDITYYLYSSGEVSIIEVPYIKWDNDKQTPKEYLNNPLYEQLGGGTNSDAIADVITTQLSDKWLNIIVTDGDLNSLMHRENIHALLQNVFVVSVHSSLQENLKGISVHKDADAKHINTVLQSVNLSG